MNMTDFYWTVGSLLTMFILGLLVMLFFFRGLAGSFFKVKASRGRKLLVRIHDALGTRYKAGWVEENFLVYKDRKDQKRINIEAEAVYTHLGVKAVDVDAVKNCIINYHKEINNKAVTGFDADKFNSLYIRALYKPQILDNRQIIMIIMLIGILLILIVMGFVLYQVMKKEDLILQNTKMIYDLVYNSTKVGMNTAGNVI